MQQTSMAQTLQDSLLAPLFGAGALGAAFSDPARLQAMLDFEAALARAQAGCGVIPASSAQVIGRCCDAALFDVGALGQATMLAGNPAIPLVKALTEQVAAVDAQAARHVHWGATSQDVIDTGLVLQLRVALGQIGTTLERLSDVLISQADAHRASVMVGRTLLQHALPITLGLKFGGWLDAITRHRARLHDVRSRALVLQFGGASGTLAALGEQGIPVASALGEELVLPVPSLPWHTHRDRLAEVATTLGLLVGTLGKIGRDIALAMQTEVGELLEPAQAGKGGSSAMPHKRNPVSAVVVQAAALRVPGLVSTMLTAMLQEHERAAGGWHAEWEVLPQIAQLTAGALQHVLQMVEGLEIDQVNMAANLELTHGLIMAEAVTVALATHLGRQEAYQIVERASRRALAERRDLRGVLGEAAEVAGKLSPAELDRLFQFDSYLGSANQFIDRAISAARQIGA